MCKTLVIIIYISLISLSCATKPAHKIVERKTASHEVLLGSKVIFSSAISPKLISKNRSTSMSYILITEDSDEIGLLNCDANSIPFTANKAHIAVYDRYMKKILTKNATAIINIKYKDCKDLVDQLILGDIALELIYGKNSKYSINSMTTYINDSILNIISN